MDGKCSHDATGKQLWPPRHNRRPGFCFFVLLKKGTVGATAPTAPPACSISACPPPPPPNTGRGEGRHTRCASSSPLLLTDKQALGSSQLSIASVARMKSKLPEGAMSPLYLTAAEESEIRDNADRVLDETIAAYDAFVAQGRTFPREQWRRVKTSGSLTAYRTRKRSASSSQKPSRVTASSSGEIRASMLDALGQSSPHSMSSSGESGTETSTLPAHMQIVVITGIVPGTLEDAAFGNIGDSEAVWKLRTTYTNEVYHDSKILATILQPSKADPFRFLGVKWAVKKLPAFLAMRDMVFTESVGLLRDPQTGKATTGYSLMHSVELPGIPHLSEFDVLRLKLSHCYISRAHDDKSIEIFCRAFYIPAGDLMNSLSAAIYAEGLLTSTNIMDCAQMKKVMWLTHQKRQNNVQYTTKTLDAATHCQWCSQGFKLLLGSFTRAASACHCCKRILCGKCSIKKDVIVDLTEDGVTQMALPYCAQCMAEAKDLSALDIAIATAPN